MTDIESLRGPIHIAPSTVVGYQCVWGYPKEQRLRGHQRQDDAVGVGEPVSVGPNCLIANQVIVYEGVSIEAGCVVEDRVRIGYDCVIAARARIIYGAYLCDRVTVGSDATVAGFVCDAAKIGDRSTVMGELVHEYTRPHEDWWEVDEAPPTIEEDSVVGRGAHVIGGVRVGPCSYVAAGAIVTKDVPPRHIVTGTNQLIPAAQWSGRKLQSLIKHWTSTSPAGFRR